MEILNLRKILNLKKEEGIAIKSKEQVAVAMQLEAVGNIELCNYNPPA